jgi:polyhydroxybutyrate depolymerase
VIDPFRQAWAWLERLRSRRLISGAIRHGGLIRSYLLYVPRHLQGKTALPLVLVFHGGAGRPQEIARMSAMHQIAEREGFIVAYPAGTPGRLGLTWNPGGQAVRSTVDDVDFVRTLIEELQQRYNVDPDRVYATGMSMGGMLAYRLACSMSETLAAIGVVAGVMLTENCRPTRPVPVIHIHGTADQRVPLAGGRGRRTPVYNSWPPVQRGIRRWCEINRCEGPEETVRLVDGLIGHRHTGAADVELWLVEGGRHVWFGRPASGWLWWRRSAPGGFSASEKVWSFFAAHPRTQSFVAPRVVRPAARWAGTL